MANRQDYPGINWLTDDQYHMAVTKLRLHIGGVLYPLRKYGQGDYVDEAIVQLTKVCEDFGLQVRGVNHPLADGGHPHSVADD